MSFIKLIIKNPFRKKSKAILSIFGLTLAVLVLLTLFSFVASVESSIEKSIIAGGDLTIFKGLDETDNFENTNPDDLINLNKLNNSDLDTIKSMEGVKKAIPIYVNYGTEFSYYDENSFESSILYFDQDNYNLIGIDLREGKLFNNNNEVIVSKEYVDITKNTIGNKINVYNKSYTIVGIFSGNNMYPDFVALPLSEIPYNKYSNSTYIEKIVVKLDEGYDVNLFSENVHGLNKGLAPMSSADGLPNKFLYDLINEIITQIYLFAIIFGTIIVLYSTLSSVNDRTREIGVLKSVGWSNKMITVMIMAESFVLSLVSWIVGSIISIIVIEFIISNFLSFVPVFNLTVFINTLLIIVIIAVLGGLYPTYRAINLSPTEALRYE
ncbi:MAG: ABC transporter permease [Methanobacteriaceae archaeon]|jgi:putative ABC transport system permease protein|nr:ABC transporter permease [Candidatus Methanorudis spinitermitis]